MANTRKVEQLDDAKTISDMNFTEEELEEGALDLIGGLTFDPSPRVTVVPTGGGNPTDTEISVGRSRGIRSK
jgi:hypothetical protein